MLRACKRQRGGLCALPRVVCSAEEASGVTVLAFSKPIAQLRRLDRSELTSWVVAPGCSSALMYLKVDSVCGSNSQLAVTAFNWEANMM